MGVTGITDGVAELRRIVGDIDDVRAAVILSLDPSVEEIEEAIAGRHVIADDAREKLDQISCDRIAESQAHGAIQTSGTVKD